MSMTDNLQILICTLLNKKENETKKQLNLNYQFYISVLSLFIYRAFW